MTTNKPEVVLDEFYNAEFPRHERTSCSDEDPSNASPDGFGCKRCNAIIHVRAERLQAECEALRKAAETSAADANAAERECSKALRTLEGLERVAKVVSDNSDAVCGENNQLRVECEKMRKDAERYRWLRLGAHEDSDLDRWEHVGYVCGVSVCTDYGFQQTLDAEALDAAIDAAMQRDLPRARHLPALPGADQHGQGSGYRALPGHTSKHGGRGLSE